ncbi:MAG TPA: ferrochelatase [Methylomirabilota bacterium]|nr:ferrochelatase [Methylomirabilota bacterium]
MSAVDCVLLIAFGGPTAPEEIRPFLEIVTRGRRIPRERLEDVAHHYERLPGARSPLNELTVRQASALHDALARTGRPLPVFVGMRNWHPFLRETLTVMAAGGHRRGVGIILSPFRSEASWERYMKDVADAQQHVPRAPEIMFAPPWAEHPAFVTAAADRVRVALESVPASERTDVAVVFTAHSIPRAMADASPYVADFDAAARAVAERLGLEQWTLAYQSRSGRPDDPWLEPDIGHVVQQLAGKGVRHLVVMPLGFVCDHVEVLYDLDIEARELASASGVALHRAAAVNDHPHFVSMLADLVQRACA